MDHFRVKLQAVKVFPSVFKGGNFCIRGGCGNLEPCRQFAGGVTMAHPASNLLLDASKDTLCILYVKLGKAVFPLFDACHFSAERINHVLHAVTDAKDWNP